MRSKWKVSLFHKKLFLLRNKKKKYFLMARSCLIHPMCVGKRFLVHNGKKFIELKVKPEMVGFKFGEFVFTRLMCSGIDLHINKKNRRKNLKGNKKK